MNRKDARAYARANERAREMIRRHAQGQRTRMNGSLVLAMVVLALVGLAVALIVEVTR